MREPNFSGVSTLPPEQADIRRQQEIAKVLKLIPDFAKDGALVQGSCTDAGEVSVSHGLRRQPKGWVVVSPRGDADRVSLVEVSSSTESVRVKNVGATGSLSFSLWVW